ncbi:MAG: MBL fold metallo-hydrolase [Bryobacteraceae bacterium]|nr:MBL fold metallo-hydrolase [Bryobacteraceae bacterium]
MCYKGTYRGGLIVKVCILASSSSGNCAFIGTQRTRILVDAGLSRKATFERLAAIGERPAALDAIVVTHEHTDHVSGLAVIAKAHGIPIYMTSLTAPTIPWADFQPKIVEFQAGTGFTIGDIQAQSFTIPHDASDPVGFCFQADGVKVGLVTDLGYVPESVKFHLRGTQLLILESNHDLEMLKVGPYPWSVKQRVMGRRGHLSNDVASHFVRDGLDGSTRVLVLGHLSEHNNHPEIARVTAMQALADRALDSRLVVVEPGRQTEVFQF